MPRKPTTNPNPASNAVARAAAIPANPAPINDLVDRWIALRAQRAHSIVGYTPATQLYKDFTNWHVAEYPDYGVPTDSAFIMALRTAYKIRFENLVVQEPLAAKKMQVCVSLMLNPAIRAVAA